MPMPYTLFVKTVKRFFKNKTNQPQENQIYKTEREQG